MHKVIFYVAAGSTFIAGVLHLAIIPMFFTLMPMNVMVFFLVSAASQLFWVIPVLKRWSNLWYYVGIVGTGLPVSELELTIELLQIVFIISCIMIVRTTKVKMVLDRSSRAVN